MRAPKRQSVKCGPKGSSKTKLTGLSANLAESDRDQEDTRSNIVRIVWSSFYARLLHSIDINLVLDARWRQTSGTLAIL